MARIHSWTCILFVASLSFATAPATAQYINGYNAPEKPEVEVNLDILNQIQEQKYREEHDVSFEALPPVTAPQPRVLRPLPAAPAPIISKPPSKRLLKPVFTARPAPAPAQPMLSEQEMETPAPIVSQPPVKGHLPTRKPFKPQVQQQAATKTRNIVPSVPLHVDQADRKPLHIVNDPFDPGATDITLYDAPAVEAPVNLEEPPIRRAMPVVPTLADLTLSFAGHSSDLSSEAQRKLNNVIHQMDGTIEGRLQVRGYAAGENGSQSSARRIALSRTLAVRSYLMDHGVNPARVDVRAMGSETDRSPLDRVDLIFAK